MSAARSVGSYDGLDAARLDAREVEQRVDQLEQAQAVAVDDGERLAVRRRQASGPRASRSSSGPSMSVSGVRNSWLTLLKNVGLGAVELGQRLGALALLLVGARPAPPRADLRGDEVEEVAVVALQGEEAARSRRS